MALVAGSFILIQPVLAQVQNADEDSWCVDPGFSATASTNTYIDLRLADCDSHFINIYQTFDDGDEVPPFEWGYDPETQYIRTLTKPYQQVTTHITTVYATQGDVQWVQSGFHRCFGTDVGDRDPEERNILPWYGNNSQSSRFRSHWCGTLNPNGKEKADKWLYDSDTKLLSLDSFPDWCLTMSPAPAYPSPSIRFLFLAKCGDPTEHWAELEATGLLNSYPKVYSQRWEIPLAEPEEEEETGEEPRRSRVTVPGEEEEEEESEDDGPILNKDGKLGSKNRGKN